MGHFEIKDKFYMDGEPVQIISGAIHYFRVVPEYWQDRLEKLKNLGCNTVETYIPWNMHEQEKGQFRFEGILDIERFIRLAQKLGLYVILRPSPYICAEWEFGGLPAWLLREEGMKLRVSYAPFLRHVEEYYRVLLPKLAPWQCTKGGPVILMQVENEYGYYANDKGYLEAIRRLMTENGVEVPLVTSDGPFPESLNAGRIPGALPTGEFRLQDRGAVPDAAGIHGRSPDVHGILGGLVRPLGQRRPHEGQSGGEREGLGQDAGDGACEHLHVRGRHQFRLHERLQLLRRADPGRDLLRL